MYALFLFQKENIHIKDNLKLKSIELVRNYNFKRLFKKSLFKLRSNIKIVRKAFMKHFM
jgi:hypothetical protein